MRRVGMDIGRRDTIHAAMGVGGGDVAQALDVGMRHTRAWHQWE